MSLRKIKKMTKRFQPGLEGLDEEEEDLFDHLSDSDHNRTNSAFSFESEDRSSVHWRESNGRCTICGQQTHVQRFGMGDYVIALTLPNLVKDGKCLLQDRHSRFGSSRGGSTRSDDSLSSSESNDTGDGDGKRGGGKKSKHHIQTYRGHAGRVYSVEELRDGKSFITGAWDKTAILWDAISGNAKEVFNGHSNGLFCVCPFNLRANKGRDFTFLSGSIDSTVKLWNAQRNECIKTFEEGSSVRCVKSLFSNPADSMHVFCTGTLEGTCNLWDADSGKTIQKFKGHSDWLSSIDMIQEGRTLVTSSADKTAKVWNVETGECLETFEGHTMRVDTVCKLDEDVILTGSADKTIKMWDTGTGKLLRTFKGHTHHVTDIAMVNSFWFLTTSKDQTAKLWDSGTGKCIRTFKGHKDSLNSVFVMDGNTFVTASSDATARLWSVT